MKQVLATGVIRSPHGVRGFVKVHPFSDDFDHFFELKEVTLQRGDKTRKEVIESVQSHSGELLIKFRGIDSPEDARFVSGWDILVPREQASKLGEGEVYTADLQGMKLVYENEEVAEVVSVMDGAQALLLEVKTGRNDRLHLVPYMKGVFIDDVDVEA
ncbi:MAG: 16S rRNA processing protein RimM, partial [Spirochaetales bacterium]|nr:16S rRNA processing protein RimM [Spirochaetales bacterium]